MPQDLPFSSIPAPVDPADWNYLDPTRSEMWRYARVQELVDHQPQPLRCDSYDDDYVCTMRQFMLARSRLMAPQLAAKFPGPFYAYQIYSGAAGGVKLWIEARILARQTDEEIAARVGTTGEAIRWFEAVFYNVRPHLDCDDWINAHAFRPAEWASNYFAHAVRLNAYYSGVVALELLLNSVVGRKQSAGEYPRTQDEIEAYLLDSAVSHVAKMTIRVAQLSLIPKTSVNELLDAYQSMLAIAKSACEDSKGLRVCVQGDQPEAPKPDESTGRNSAGASQETDTRGHQDGRQRRRKKKLAVLDAVVARTVWQYGKGK